MAAKGDVQKDIDEIKKSFNDIDRAILDGTKNYRLLQASISKTNGILGSTNWVIFSRFISGTPLWRIQNRVKASVMLLNEYLSASEKNRLKEAERLKIYSQIAKTQRGSGKIAQDLKKIASMEVGEAQEHIAALQEKSELFDGLYFQYQDHVKAANELLDIVEAQNKEADKLRATAQRAARKEAEKRKLENAGIKERMKSFIGLNAFKDKARMDDLKKFMKMEDKKVKITKKMQAVAAKAGLDPQELLRKDGSMKAPTADRNTKQVVMRRGSSGKTLNPKQLEALQKLHTMGLKQNGMRAKFYRLAAKPMKAVMAIGTAVKKLVFYALAQFMKLMLLLIVIVAAFKIIEPFLGNIWKAITTMASVLYQGIMMVVSGIATMFTGVYNILDGIYNMDLAQIWEGIGQVVGGILDVVAGLFVATVGTLLAGAAAFIGSLFMDGFNALGGGINGIIGGVGRVVKGIAGVVAGVALVVSVIGMILGAAIAFPALIVAGIALALYLAIDPIVSSLVWISDNVLKPIWNAISDFSISDAINDLVAGIKEAVGQILDKIPKPSDAIKKITSKIPFLATGGNVKQSGIAVVGEKGPELVNLPAGARVSSNRDSAAMLGGGTTIHNHITVQVTGRVGANDTEIRDIANKVAKEINSRMNRTSTSVVKF